MEFVVREYGLEESRVLLQREPCFHHPLQLQDRAGAAATEERDSPRKLVLDLNQDIDDPLQGLSADPSSPTSLGGLASPVAVLAARAKRGVTGDEVERAAAAEWEAKKSGLLQRFTATGSITVTSSLEVMTKPGRSRLRVSQRLAALERPEQESSEALCQVTQEDMVLRLRQLNADLSQAWVSAERLTALRLAIKVSRLLLDTSVPQFYPTLWVLVTDCLDTVGGLVWVRILRKAEGAEGGPQRKLPAGFTCADVSPEAQDTCRNWFYKVGAIHELLPRIYMELALLRCYHFLEPGPPSAALSRLAAMMRGLTDPLASAYAHLYLARRIAAVVPAEKGPLHSGLRDLLLLYRGVLAGHVTPPLDRALYLQLLDPPLDLTLQALVKDAPPARLSDLLAGFAPLPSAVSHAEPAVGSAVLHLVAHLPPPFVAEHALHFTRVIAATTDESAKQAVLFCTLGRQLAQTPPPVEQRVPLLQETWKVVARYSDLEPYLAVADVTLDFVLRHFRVPEVEVLLRDIARHVRAAAPSAAALAALEHLVYKLATHRDLLPALLPLPQFGALLAAFQGDLRLTVHRRILEAATERPALLRRPSSLAVLLDVARSLHDALDPATPDDVRRTTARSLSTLILKVPAGQDVAEHLRFLGDCRAAFGNLPVQAACVQAALRCAEVVQAEGAGQPRGEQHALVRACIAFCEVTLPAVEPLALQLHLLLATAEVSLQAGLLGHMDACLRAILAALAEGHPAGTALEADMDAAALLAFVRKLASFLVVAPGHPEAGPLTMLHRLLAALEGAPGLALPCAAASLLPAVAALAQRCLPYHVAGVASNDALYAGEPQYGHDLRALASKLVHTALAGLHPEQGPQPEAGSLALHVCDVLLAICQPDEEVARTCSNLLASAQDCLPSASSRIRATEHRLEDLTRRLRM